MWADPFGRLFIETDGAQPEGANDQMLVADPERNEFRRLFAGVASCDPSLPPRDCTVVLTRKDGGIVGS